MKPTPTSILSVCLLAWGALAAAAQAPAAAAAATAASASTRPTSRPTSRPTTRPVRYGPGRLLAVLSNRHIRESSGVAFSRRREDVLWTHNDSGDRPRLFAFDTKGRHVAEVTVAARAADWEDIASFTLDGKAMLLVADVGDNSARRRRVALQLLAEPDLGARRPGTLLKAAPVMSLTFSYPDGPRDCEAVAVDPTTATVYLVSKQHGCGVYELPLPERPPKEALVAKKIGSLGLLWVTAMDISPDGRRALVLTYGDAYEYARGDGETWAAAFKRKPRRIPLPPRIQGEAACYGPDGRTLYLTSERLPTPLLVVPPAK
jgi:hypothetical protein